MGSCITTRTVNIQLRLVYDGGPTGNSQFLIPISNANFTFPDVSGFNKTINSIGFSYHSPENKNSPVHTNECIYSFGQKIFNVLDITFDYQSSLDWLFQLGGVIPNPLLNNIDKANSFIKNFRTAFIYDVEKSDGSSDTSFIQSTYTSLDHIFTNIPLIKDVVYVQNYHLNITEASYLKLIQVETVFEDFVGLDFQMDPGGSGVISPAGKTIWLPSQGNVSLTASPYASWKRKLWSIDTGSLGDESLPPPFENTVDLATLPHATFLDPDVAITIEFEELPYYSVTLDVNPNQDNAWGALGSQSLGNILPRYLLVEEGSGTTASIRPNFGWKIDSWVNADNPNLSGGNGQQIDNYISNVTAPITVTANLSLFDFVFPIIHHSSTGNHGTIKVNGVVSNEAVGSIGETLTLSFEPDSGYRVESVFGDPIGTAVFGGAVGDILFHNFDITSSKAGPYSFKNIYVKWALPTYTVTIANPIGNGSIIPSPGVINDVLQGTEINLQADADFGWFVAGWLGTDANNKTGGNDEVKTNISTITANTTIQVTFAQTQFTIDGVAHGNGTIVPSSRKGVLNGIVEFTAKPTPGSGLSVTGWTGTNLDTKTSPNPEDQVSNTRTINGNGEVHVFFNVVPSITITTEVASGQGTLEGGGIFIAGTTITVTAKPSSGWAVSGWTKTTVLNKIGGDGETVDNNVIADVSKTVTVTFVQVAFTVTGVVDDGQGEICVKKTSGPCVGSSPASSGSIVTFTATPANGWFVNKWRNMSNDNLTGSTNVPIDNSTNSIVSSLTVGVEFAQEQVTITTGVNAGSGHGTIGPSSQTVPINSTPVGVTANPDSGWKVFSWSETLDDNLTGSNGQPVSNTALTEMSKLVEVNFIEVNAPVTYYLLTVSIAPGHASKGFLITTSGQVLAGTTINLKATPNAGFVISHWDGADAGEFDKVTMNSNKTVILYFADEGTVPNAQKYITVKTDGNGWVSPNSGAFDVGSKKIFTAGAFSGSKFVQWQGVEADPDLKLIGSTGTQLEVFVTSNKTITAEFEEVEDFVDTEENVFYCPSRGRRNNVISFTHAVAGTFQYRLIFYSDVEKTILVSTVLTFVDTRNWYVEDTSLQSFPISGEVIGADETRTIYYNPEISSLRNIEQQRINDIAGPPLHCGLEYTVDIFSTTDNKSYDLLSTVNFIVPCEEIDGYFWRQNIDANNWICSGQGKDDLRVSFSGEQSLFSSIASNQFGYFLIAWQSRRKGKNSIYGAIWDSEKDKLFSSGQGLYDKLYLPEGYNPHVLTDQAQNFYISSNSTDKIFSYKCSLPLSCSDDPPQETVFDKLCYPGIDTFLDIDPIDILVRVFKEDQKTSIVIDNNKTLPVVDKQDIRIDVSGIQGAYAVRVRNSEDSEWGDFINIDAILFDNPNNVSFPTPDDDSFDAYFIGSDRFIIPWKLSAINGIRRACLQVLTFYGISNTICLDLFVNLETLSYRVDYFSDEDLTLMVNEFNGFPILTEEKGEVTGVPVEGTSTTVYIKITFSEKQSYGNDELKFNVFQQGLSDQHGLPLSLISAENGTYKGSFEIRKHDGIYNKDGIGFVNITFPNDPLNIDTGCISDQSDKFNLLLNTKDLSTFSDSDPKNVLKKDNSGLINKVLDINELKQFYNKDDENFRFGDPKVFRTE